MGVTAWVLETPMEIRDAAAMDFVKSFRSNLTKRKKNLDHIWEHKFRIKKDREQTIKNPRARVFNWGALST